MTRRILRTAISRANRRSTQRLMQESITAEEYRKRVRGRVNRRQGEITEDLVRDALERAGYTSIVKLENAWTVKRAGNQIVGAWPRKKVEGDFRAMYDGISVHVEAKSSPGKLLWSDLKNHQIHNLDEHVRCGGISILAWTDTQTWRVHLLRWPVEGFGAHRPITAEDL